MMTYSDKRLNPVEAYAHSALKGIWPFMAEYDLSEKQKRLVIQFLSEMHCVRWGKKSGRKTFIDTPLELIWVDCNENGDEHTYSEFVIDVEAVIEDRLFSANERAEKMYSVARDLIFEFGNLDFDQRFWYWVITDAQGALTERLLGMRGEYFSRWQLYQKGYYLCGYQDEKTVYIY